MAMFAYPAHDHVVGRQLIRRFPLDRFGKLVERRKQHIRDAPAVLAHDMRMRCRCFIEPAASVRHGYLFESARVGKLVQISIYGTQAKLRVIAMQRLVNHIRSRMLRTRKNCLVNAFPLVRIPHIRPSFIIIMFLVIVIINVRITFVNQNFHFAYSFIHNAFQNHCIDSVDPGTPPLL